MTSGGRAGMAMGSGLITMTPDEAKSIRAEISSLRVDIADLTAMIRTEGERCPHREDIARSRNNREQINRNTDDIGALKVSDAVSKTKLGILMAGSSGIGGVIVAVLTLLFK